MPKLLVLHTMLKTLVHFYTKSLTYCTFNSFFTIFLAPPFWNITQNPVKQEFVVTLYNNHC